MGRLSDWRRLRVVLVVLWAGIVGVYAWSEWPQQSDQRIRSFNFSDSSKGDLIVRWYGESGPPNAVVTALRAVDRRRPRPPAVPGNFVASDLGHVYEIVRVDRRIGQQQIAEAVTLEGVGLVHFPAGTSKATVQDAVTEFFHGVSPRQREHLKQSAWLFLIPALLLYGVGWIARGFRRTPAS